MTFHIKRKEPLPDAVRRIASEQIMTAIADISGDRHPPDRAIHQYRKHCKKLRGILRLVRPALGEVFAVEEACFRDAAKLVKLDREHQVIRHTLKSLLVNESAEVSERLLKSLEKQLQTANLSDTIGTKDPSPPTRFCIEMMRSALARVEFWPLEIEEFEDVRDGFESVYSRCCRSWTKVRKKPTDTNYHRLRKWTKYHWYHIRLLERMNKPVMHASRENLKSLEAALGNSNDLAELASSLSNGDETTQIIQLLIDQRKNELLQKATEICETAFAENPAAYADRHAAYWAAWRCQKSRLHAE